MNIEFSNKLPWLSLVLLWLSYAVLGWCLSAYDIFWFIGIFVAVLALATVWKSVPCLEGLLRFASRGFFAIFTMLAVSILFALAASWSLLVTLIIPPLITTFLSNLEMRFAGFSKQDTLLLLTVLAGLGLGLGETIDIIVSPSVRY